MKRVVAALMIISLLVLLGGSIFAQGTSNIDARLLNQAGHQLESYASQYYTGYWIEVGGIFLTGVGGAIYSATLTLLGFVLYVAGGVIQFLAAENVGAAGASLISATSPATKSATSPATGLSIDVQYNH